jgi:hypothetical protein
MLTRLVARELSAASGAPQIRAATAYLLPGVGRSCSLEQVEVADAGSQGRAGICRGQPITGFLRAGEGWVDLEGGNLLLRGGVLGQTQRWQGNSGGSGGI